MLNWFFVSELNYDEVVSKWFCISELNYDEVVSKSGSVFQN